MATTRPEKRTVRDLGSSGTQVLEEIFIGARSGRYDLSNYDPVALQLTLVNGTIQGNPLVPAFSLDWSNAPKIIHYVPNPISAGGIPGSDVPVGGNQTGDLGNFPASFVPNSSGYGSQTAPAQTSPAISQQDFQNLSPGESGA